MIPKLKKQSRNNKKDKPAGIAEKVICLLSILNKIDQGQLPSPVSLAEEYGLTRRSIHRYLEIINFIVPIEYDKEKKGYKFSGKNSLKKLQLSDNEMMLILMLGDSIAHLGTPLKDSYHSLVSKVLSSAKNPTALGTLPIIFNIPEVNDSIEFQKNFPVIADSIINRRSLDIKYDAVHSQEITERRVNPYGLVFSNGTWIMIGYCHLADGIRKFDLDRILELKQTSLKFKTDDFDLKTYIDKRWGMYDGEPCTVKVRFSKQIAHLITRKKKWHLSEERTILPSGEVELAFTVAGVNKLKQWLYTWIPNVEIIEPTWLRDEIKKELLRNYELYS